MGKVQNPLTGRMSGQVGNNIFAKQFGKNTVRSKPLEIKDANSELQQDQRGKMKSIGHLIMSITAVLLSYLPKALSDMPFGSWLAKTFAKGTSFVLSTGMFTFDFTKFVGGMTAFYGDSLSALRSAVDAIIRFNVNSIYPIYPKTGNTFNVVVFSKTLVTKFLGTKAITVTSGVAEMTIEDLDNYGIVATDIVVISPVNVADTNNNYPKTTYKISSSKRLNSFCLAAAIVDA